MHARNLKHRAVSFVVVSYLFRDSVFATSSAHRIGTPSGQGHEDRKGCIGTTGKPCQNMDRTLASDWKADWST